MVMKCTHVAILGGAVGSSGGSGGSEQVKLALGGEVVPSHGVRRGAPVRDGRAGTHAETPEDSDPSIIPADLRGEVGRRERDGPGLPERVPGDVVRPDGLIATNATDRSPDARSCVQCTDAPRRGRSAHDA
jgi:hypothetical protein